MPERVHRTEVIFEV